MSALTGVRGQTQRDAVFATTITIGSGGGQYLVLPEHRSRSFLEICTTSAYVGYIAIGAGEATAAITSGAVSGITLVNSGFGYTYAPQVILWGGGSEGNSTFIGCGAPMYGPPGSTAGAQPIALGSLGTPATAHAVVSSNGTLTSIAVDMPGSGYVCAPHVQLLNNTNDPNGCASPYVNSVGVGRVVTSANPLYYNGTACPTSPVAVYCATSGAQFFVKWMP